MGLYQLAGIHLSQDPPNFEAGRLAIDAMAAIIEGLPGRLGEDESTIRGRAGAVAHGIRPAKRAARPAGAEPPIPPAPSRPIPPLNRNSVHCPEIRSRSEAPQGTMVTMEHPSAAELEAGLDHIRRSPADYGRLELIARRPAVDEREVLAEGRLSVGQGLEGDTWPVRSSTSSVDGGPHPAKQLTIMNARAIALMAGGRDQWALAGDQLYVDLDISAANLPPGTRLAIGSAVVEITEPPHLGCQKFSARFGLDALRFVNSPVGRELHLRGVNARIVVGGTVRAGDRITKVESAAAADIDDRAGDVAGLV